MREAMAPGRAAGTDGAIAALKRDPANYLGFVEVHIEQGPVLNELDLPLGVVTSINGSVRYVGEVTGMASHAGTTPMDRRRDAAAAVAELALYVEQRAAARAGPGGHRGHARGAERLDQRRPRALPVQPRHPRHHRRGARRLRRRRARPSSSASSQRRGLPFTLEETMRASAAPSAPAWQRRWEPRRSPAGPAAASGMPSGAGHDAMKLHEVMPQAMLFMRGLNCGISHNPLETITNDDAELAVRAFQALLEQLAAPAP